MLTQSELKKHLHYNPDTGIFTWIKKRPSARNIKIGSIAGSQCSGGYVLIGSGQQSKTISAHRLAFLYMKGAMPIQVDHINHITNDNRWCNLRAVDMLANLKNKQQYKNNKSGHNGVCFIKRDKKWSAYLTYNKKRIRLGYYSNKNDAIKARKDAEKLHPFHKNHGIKLERPTPAK